MLLVGGNIAIIKFNWTSLVNAPQYLTGVGISGLD